MNETKSQKSIKVAYLKGYRVQEDGSVLSPHGKIRKLTFQANKKSRNPYLRFNIGVPSGELGSRHYPIAVHKLAAYQKFGDSYFQEGIVARHLDGDCHNNSLDNIAIGTHQDNMLDRPPELRREQSIKGWTAASRSLRPRRFTDDEVAQIRTESESGVSYKELEKKWND